VFAGALASLASSCTSGKVASQAPTAPASLVRFVGRFDSADPEHPRFAWPASAIATRFASKSLHVKLKGKGYAEFQVLLDGAPVRVLSTNPAREDYEVASGLDGGEHDLVLAKRTEARMGELQFLGFEPREALTPTASATRRHIELIGDSITAGYGDEGGGATCTGDMVSLENEYISYGAIASRALGADHVTIAWSGRTTEEMGELFERTLPAHTESRWDFKAWTPDAVVINLGTNDFNRGDPGQVAFTRPYVALLRRVRALYTNAQIVCALGPMLTDNYPPGAHALARARAYITQAVADVRAAGDANVVFLEFPTQEPANGLGCDYHPSRKTHAAMGEQLASVLREKLRW